MVIDNVVERTTIEFKRPLNLDKTRELFKYMAGNLPGEVDYTVESHESIDGQCQAEKDKSLETETRKIYIHGKIWYKNVVGTKTFRCKTSMKNPLLIEALKFFSIPGYELGEIEPEEVELWDKVREQITNYFNSNTYS